MWIGTGVVAVIALLLPGSPDAHLGWMLGLAAFAVAWGAFSLHMGLHWERAMSIERRTVVTAAMMPVVGVALWATGGATSFLAPVLLFTALFVAYFFPPRLAWPLVGLFVAAYASPLVYDDVATGVAYPARATLFTLGVVGATYAMQVLKHRLVRAEAHQRAMAELDPLTGLPNRRSFDIALADGARRRSAALVLFDFDGFKAINDVHGHPVGDAVLCAVADACRTVVREGDCLARIGGDEFALVAPGAGEAGVQRMVAALDEAVTTAQLPRGVGAVRATFAWALAPTDGTDPASLFASADQRLLAGKQSERGARATRA
jgi:diguanylate cyclase (GGDEF)-like protein